MFIWRYCVVLIAALSFPGCNLEHLADLIIATKESPVTATADQLLVRGDEHEIFSYVDASPEELTNAIKSAFTQYWEVDGDSKSNKFDILVERLIEIANEDWNRILALFSHDSMDVRYASAVALSYLERDGSSSQQVTLGAFAHALLVTFSHRVTKNSDILVFEDTLEFLVGTLGEYGDAGMLVLLRGLRSKNSGVRYWSAKALEPLYEHPEDAFPTLLDFLTDPDSDLRCYAIKRLNTIGYREDDWDGILREMLHDTDESVRYEAWWAIPLPSEDGREEVLLSTLTSLFSSGSTDVQVWSVRELITSKYDLPRVIPDMAMAIRNSGDPWPFVVAAVLAGPDAWPTIGEALGHPQEGMAASVPYLLEALRHPQLWREALGALAILGPHASGAIDMLWELEREAVDPDSRMRIGVALWRISGDPGPALRSIYEAPSDHTTIGTITWGVTALGPMAESLTTSLIDRIAVFRGRRPMSRDGNSYIRGWITQALVHIGDRAVPVLIAALGNREWYVREAVVLALGGIGAGAAEALPYLEVLDRDTEAEVRIAAAKAIYEITAALENQERK